MSRGTEWCHRHKAIIGQNYNRTLTCGVVTAVVGAVAGGVVEPDACVSESRGNNLSASMPGDSCYGGKTKASAAPVVGTQLNCECWLLLHVPPTC